MIETEVQRWKEICKIIRKSVKHKICHRTSLAGQWLRLHAFNVGEDKFNP